MVKMRSWDLGVLLLWWLLFCSSVSCCWGSTSSSSAVEDVRLEVREFTSSLLAGNEVREIFYASIAKFGPSLKKTKSVEGRMTTPPTSNPLLCQSVTQLTSGEFWKDSILMVPRGECAFTTKVRAAQALGAKAVIIYNNLASRYQAPQQEVGNGSNGSNGGMVWPQSQLDYECGNGRSWILAQNLDLTNDVYNAEVNDKYLKNEECGSHDEKGIQHFQDNCDSKKCLLTGVTSSGDGNFLEACCAWDVPSQMSAPPNDNHTNDDITIPSIFVTMKTGDALELLYRDSNLYLSLYLRKYPDFNLSSLILVIIATVLTWYASFRTTKEYRQLRKIRHTHISIIQSTPSIVASTNNPMSSPNSANGFHLRLTSSSGSSTTTQNRRNQQQEDDTSIAAWSNASTVVHHNRSSSMHDAATAAAPASIPGQASTVATDTDDTNDMETPTTHTKDTNAPLILQPWHVLLFVLMASGGLLILFYFKFYNTVKVVYAFAAAGAITTELILPLARFILPCKTILQIPCFQTSTPNSCIAQFTVLSVSSLFLAYIWTILWLWYGFITIHPETHFFYWFTQNIMGACLCILFQSLLRLNSIKVATYLLIALFVYDIFFVFISPHIFGSNVMIDVATSGGPPNDAQYCQKYPEDRSECNGGMPLPMLLILPRISDYRGGLNLLGLGDIVLPGLLISLGARLDAAKLLLQPSSSPPNNIFLGYFLPLMFSYAIGLFLANLALYVTGEGQPALLYLVPFILGTTVFIGHRTNELKLLWNGHPQLQQADELLSQHKSNMYPNYNHTRSTSQQQQHQRSQEIDEEANELSPTSLSNIREGSETGGEDEEEDVDDEFLNEAEIRNNGPPYVLSKH